MHGQHLNSRIVARYRLNESTGLASPSNNQTQAKEAYIYINIYQPIS